MTFNFQLLNKMESLVISKSNIGLSSDYLRPYYTTSINIESIPHMYMQ